MLTIALAAVGAALLAVVLAGALLMAAYRWVLRPRLMEELVRLSGPSIVQALLPQQVMTAFLSKIYGDDDASRDVIAGVLGGEGTEPHSADLTISAHTTVEYELRGVDNNTYELISTVTYGFKEHVTNPRFVFFATCDPLLRDSIALACRLPLFESWFIADQSLFERSVNAMLPSVHIGIRYTTFGGDHYDITPSKITLSEVSYRDWPEFLRFFRGPSGTMPRQNPARYMGTLRIFEYDLGELADADHAVASIESLSLRSKGLGRVDDRFCFWQPPYPCYVEHIFFDASTFSTDGSSWLFQVVPFMFRSAIVTSGWIQAKNLKGLAVNSWLLPGHGVTLLWKPSPNEPTTLQEI